MLDRNLLIASCLRGSIPPSHLTLLMKRSLLTLTILAAALSSYSRADLIGYWDFEGNFDDSSGNGNNGTLMGGASYVADAPATVSGTMSVAFDGQPGTYGIINPAPGTGMGITDLPDFTVSMWVNGDGTANLDDRIFSESQGLNEAPLFNIGTHNTGADARLDVYIRNGAGAATVGHTYSNGNAFDSTWRHVVFTGGSDRNLDIYIDGVFDRSVDYNAVPTFTPDITTIGGILRAGNCCNFLGSIDDVAVWNQELLASDIAMLTAGTVTPLTLVPMPSDVDMDGMRDEYEQQIIDADPDDAIAALADVLPDDDFDSDGSTNANEEIVGTDPLDPDTDNDGANDGSETDTGVWISVTDRGTDPFNPDTDGDDLLDGVENPDLDYVDKDQPGTSPHLIDTDMDGFADEIEITNGTDPTDPEDPGSLPRFSIDFNSTTQDGAANPVGPPYQNYDAAHEVVDDFVRMEYEAFGTMVGLTPSWPATDRVNTTYQMIDRGAGNDADWLGTQLQLVTDWIGVDTRTTVGGLGNYDGENGDPTPILLALDGVPGGTYSWTSYHHDTENIHSPFTVEISIDGGTTYEDVGEFQMTSSNTGGSPANPAIETGPDPASLSSTVRHDFATDGLADVVFRFIPLAEVGVHRQFMAINGFDLIQTSSDFPKLAITNIDYDPDTDRMSITWPSTPGQVFSIDISADMNLWDGDLEDSLPAAAGDAEETTFTFGVADRDLGDRYFIRVRVVN